MSERARGAGRGRVDAAVVAALLWLVLGACRERAPAEGPPSPSASPSLARPTEARAPARAATAPAPDAALASEPAAEPRERNPRAPKVRLRLVVSPTDAEVFWGGKKLGVTVKGVFEIERPRGSGPLDLMLRAPGFLTQHTRMFTDRDDKLAVRLARPGEAPGLLGWKPAAPAPAPTEPPR
jgi:hypothetical protein